VIWQGMVHNMAQSLQVAVVSIMGGRVFPSRETHVTVDKWLDGV
jgi:hypothetical protein